MLAGGGEASRFALSGGQDLTKGAYSKADAVYGELKEAILSGALEPGSLIDKTGLCEKLRVSRFPVSAAVSRLAYDRLVDVAPQHGSFVARISLNDARERLFIRSALEGEIAAEAARRMSARRQGCARRQPQAGSRGGRREGSSDVLRARRGVPSDIDHSAWAWRAPPMSLSLCASIWKERAD